MSIDRWKSRLFLAYLLLPCVLALPGMALGQEAEPAAPMQRRATEASADRLLDEGLVNNPAMRARLTEEADQTPPTTTDPDTLAGFFLSRGNAAYAIGRQGQALGDLRKAAGLARQVARPDRVDILLKLSRSERTVGRNLSAMRALEEAALVAPPNRKGILFTIYGMLAEYRSQLGDIDGARAELAKGDKLAAESATFRADAMQRREWARILDRGRIAILVAQGKLAEAETVQRAVVSSLEKESTANSLSSLAQAHQILSDIHRQQGRLAEAENEARLALAANQQAFGPVSLRVASTLGGLGRILAEQGRPKEGEALVRKSIEVMKQVGSAAKGGIRGTLADILVAQFRWADARAEFEIMREFMSGDEKETFDNIIRRSPNYALALLETGATVEAEKLLADTLDANRRLLGDKNTATSEALGLHALALTRQGETQKALAEYLAAVPALIDTLAEEEDDGNQARDQRMRLVFEGYMHLLSANRDMARRHGIDPVGEAFRISEAARGRAVARALTAAAARMAANQPELAETARREQDIQKQVSALGSLLANAISARADERDSKAMEAIRERIESLRKERSALLAEVAKRFPDYARMVNPRPLSLAEVQARLKPGEALFAFYSAEHRAHAWYVPASGAPTMAEVTLTRRQLADTVGRLRQALDIQAGSLDDIPAFDLAAAHDLYQAILKPGEPVWGSANTLFVVPHGPLGQLPLALLPTAPMQKAEPAAVPFANYRKIPWLIRRVAVAQLPSSGTLATLRALPPPSAQRRLFVGFGDPVFAAGDERAPETTVIVARGAKVARRNAPTTKVDYTAQLAELPRLPDTAEEVTAIAAALGADPERDIFLGSRASERTVRGLPLSDWRIVMFATHGLIPGDLAGLEQPALALTNPAVSRESGSGLLTMEAIMALKLDADWVVLSACNTASGDGAGAEAVSGLGRAFFYAGARALLVTNWPVETVSARQMTTDLFRRQVADPNLSRAGALRQAMIALIDGPGPGGEHGGKEMFSYAHPTFWAPFALVGDGGGSLNGR